MPRRRGTRHPSPPTVQAEFSAVSSCPCGEPDSYQDMIGCDGPCAGWFHFDCAGVDISPSGEWFCLCCTIWKTRSVLVLHHIPKGARKQVA